MLVHIMSSTEEATVNIGRYRMRPSAPTSVYWVSGDGSRGTNGPLTCTSEPNELGHLQLDTSD